MKTIFAMLLVLFSSVLIYSCGGDDGESKKVCEAGKTTECPCGDLKGIQTCKADGSAWGECNCPDPELKAKDVAGTWYTDKTEIVENSCNLSESFINKLKERSYYEIDATSDTNIEIFKCEDSTCSEKESGGTYTFKPSIEMNLPNKVMDLAELFEEEDLDCKITLKIEKRFVFSSATTGKTSGTVTTSKSGGDCTSLKAELEKSEEEVVKDFAKLLNDTCSLKSKSNIKKQ